MKRCIALIAVLSITAAVLLSVPAGGFAAGGPYRASALPLHDGYWTKVVNTGDYEYGRQVACDPDGNPIVIGTITATDADIWVRKYRGSDGGTLWAKTYDGGHGHDFAGGVACDPDGNMVVVGRVSNAFDSDIWVRKYRGTDGATLWTKIVNSGGSDGASGVACDSRGDFVVVGEIFTGSGYQGFIRKYRGSDGTSLWTKTYAGPLNLSGAEGVSFDPEDNLVVAGYAFSGSNEDVWVSKYRGSDGGTLWTKAYDGGHGNDSANGVSCDPNGDVVVAGYTNTGSYEEIWVRKYRGTDGSTRWTRVVGGTAHTGDEANDVSCDMLGNAVVAGHISNGPTSDIWVRKYGPDGSTAWTETYNAGHGSDSGHGVSCDPENNPVVVGTSANPADTDIWVRKYPPGLSANTTWYLAEGSTAWGFFTTICLENPNSSDVTARVKYMTSTGPVSGGDLVLPANSQTRVDPRPVVGEADFSTKVECLEGKTIAVDRTMSWTGPGAPAFECHSSIGVVSPARRWYLAEGSSAWGFECWLLIQNPNAAAAVCDVTYMIEGAEPVTVTKSVAANSRFTFNMADDIGAKDASIMVESNVPVIPERAMYRNSRREGHDSIGTTAPAADYYLAEGTTAWGFTTYVLVQNPNDTPTDVTVTYMTTGGPRPQVPFAMPANSRKTIRVNDVLPGTDLSTQVHGTQPVIAERAMYWGADTPHGEATHDSIGMASPHKTFYLPDGDNTMGTSTHQNIETWTLVQNPNDTSVDVEISYLRSGGGAVTFTDNIPADSRKTYNMAYHIPLGSASIMVECLTPGKKVMAERAMYWRSIDVQYRVAGTDTIGGYED